MKLLLLCLGLSLACAQQEADHDAVTSNFNMEKLSGEWYSILLAADTKELIEKNGVFRLFVEDIQALDNSSLLLKYQKKINGECANFTFIAEETEEKNVYSVFYDGYNLVYITEAVYTRTPDVSPQLKERFQKILHNYGIPEENILDLTKADRCLQARESF